MWGERDGRLIFRCPDTGALFIDRAALGEETYQQYYQYLADFDSRRFDWELRIRRKKIQRQLRLMEHLAPGKRIADVGAGPGYLCRIAALEGWSPVGIEISAEAVRHGEEQFGVRYTKLEEIPDESLDVISCQHVLEHVAKPVEFLQALRRKLASSGLLVLHVPHEQPLTFFLRERLSRLLRRHRDTYCTLYGDIHVSGFSPESLARVVEGQGFKAQFIRTAGMWSRYYDPFFAREYVRRGQWLALMRKGIRSAVELLGNPVGKGDWIVGYFVKSSSE